MNPSSTSPNPEIDRTVVDPGATTGRVDVGPDDGHSRTAVAAWASLVRIPNVFTVLADVAAGFLLVAHAPDPPERLLFVLLAAVALYWGGMILNDVFDVEKDRRERPRRPLPAGEISVSTARLAGYGCLVVGIMFALVSGYLPHPGLDSTWLPGGIAVALAVLVLAYDGPLKSTALGPVLMGGCRTLSFLLGAAPIVGNVFEGGGFPRYVIAAALGFGMYVMGLTTIGRREAHHGPDDLTASGASASMNVGTMFTIIGVVMLAFAPSIRQNLVAFRVSPSIFPLAIGLIAYPVVARAIRTALRPEPAGIQSTVRSGILTIIPLAACYAVLGSGVWGIAVFALVAPAFWLAYRFRVT